MASNSNNPVTILRDLSEASGRTRSQGRGKGRFARTPRYEAPAARSSRPKSDIGVTFHFAHKAISKRNDISESHDNATSASAHQTYIERKEAGAELTDNERSLASDIFGSTPFIEDELPEEITQSEAYKKGQERGFQTPNVIMAADRMGFGTVGPSPSKRKQFWQRVERAERRHGRVQSRVIAELPFEVNNTERAKIAMSFCKTLRDNALPFWATIHAPTEKNDKRNFHLHIAYYDRPCQVDHEGRWDFEVEETVTMKNRARRKTKPLLQNKPPHVRDRSWVKNLRTIFAKESNLVLEEGGYEKRLDHRSYKESGVLKEPTQHLGFKASTMESFGLETQVGQTNAKKEYAWKIHQKTRRWDHALAQEDVVGLFMIDDLNAAMFDDTNEKRDKLLAGKEHAKRSVQAELLADQMSIRLEKRKAFLGKESSRLIKRGRGLLLSEVMQDIIVLDAEQEVIETREEDVIQMTRSLSMLSKSEAELEENIWQSITGEQAQKDAPVLDIFGMTEESEALFNTWGTQDSIAERLLGKPKQSEDFLDITGIKDDELASADEDMGVKATRASEEKSIFDDSLEDDMLFENNLDDNKAQEEDKKTPAISSNDKEVSVTEKQSIDIEENADTQLSAEQPLEIDVNKWAFLVDRPKSTDDVRELDKRLRAMTNKDVRVMAVGTRDLVDFLEPGETRDAANRGWVVLQHEASQRGLDLESGRQNLGKAKDKERAELHRDEYLRSVLEVRQEVIKIQGR